jgi:hypothetical protein
MVHFGINENVGELNLAQLEFVYGIIDQQPDDHIFVAAEFNPIQIIPPYLASLVLFMHNRHPMHGGIGNNHGHYEALHGPLWIPPMN